MQVNGSSQQPLQAIPKEQLEAISIASTTFSSLIEKLETTIGSLKSYEEGFFKTRTLEIDYEKLQSSVSAERNMLDEILSKKITTSKELDSLNKMVGMKEQELLEFEKRCDRILSKVEKAKAIAESHQTNGSGITIKAKQIGNSTGKPRIKPMRPITPRAERRYMSLSNVENKRMNGNPREPTSAYPSDTLTVRKDSWGKKFVSGLFPGNLEKGNKKQIKEAFTEEENEE